MHLDRHHLLAPPPNHDATWHDPRRAGSAQVPFGLVARVGSSVQSALRRLGWEVNRYPPRGSFERHLRDVLGKLDVDCVIDVGAHVGEFARMLRDVVGFTGRIASVEPGSLAFGRLTSAMAADSAWEGFNFALGSEERTQALHVSMATNLNSLHRLNTYAQDALEMHASGQSELVSVHRLDSVFDELTVGHSRVFLKCDTQGHDLAVIDGLGTREIVGVQVELSFLAIYDETPRAHEVVATLAKSGYTPSGFFPVLRDGLCLAEADGVFLRTAHHGS